MRGAKALDDRRLPDHLRCLNRGPAICRDGIDIGAACGQLAAEKAGQPAPALNAKLAQVVLWSLALASLRFAEQRAHGRGE